MVNVCWPSERAGGVLEGRSPLVPAGRRPLSSVVPRDLSLGSGTSCDQKSNHDSWGVGVGIHRGPLGEWGLYCSNQNRLLFVSLEYFVFLTGREVFLSLGTQALAFLVGVVTDWLASFCLLQS